MKKPSFPKVSAKFGAPLGRTSAAIYHHIGEENVHRVTLVDGYDRGGAYWGANMPGSILFVAVQEDGTQAYTRAGNTDEAIAKFNESGNF